MKALTHKNIVQLFQAFIDGKQFIMIMEAAKGGELLDYLKKKDYMPEPLARKLILQVIQAMLYCHSRGVVHRDLKLENVLFWRNDEDDMTVKVIDFGIAGVGNEKVDAGTLSYMAPECLEKVAAATSPAIDCWAIGIMLYTMIFGTLPFYASDERALVKLIRETPVKFPKDKPITAMGKQLIKDLLHKDPEKRLQLIDLVTRDYNTMSATDFEKAYDECSAVFEETKQKTDAEEEEKMQDDFVAKMQLEQAVGNHLKKPKPEVKEKSFKAGGASPRSGGKKLGTKKKK